MKKIYFFLIIAITSLSFRFFDSTYSTLTSPFTQNWTTTSLITTNDSWSGVTSIQGFRGDGLAGSTAVDPQTILAADDPGVIDVNANQTNPGTFATGGVTEFEIADPVVALSGSGTARAPYIKLYLNTSGRNNIQVAYNLRDIDGSVDNAVQPIALQYRVGTSGPFTNIAAAFVPDASSGPSLATLVTPVSVTLPTDCNNQAQVELRIMTTDAVGNDEWIGIDDINITSSSLSGADVSITSTTAAAEPGTNGSFTFAFAPATTAGSTAVNYAFGGTATFGTDYSITFSAGTPSTSTATGTLDNIPSGTTTITATITPIDDATVEGTETVSLTLSSPTQGYTIGAGSSTINLSDNDVAPTISVATGGNAAEPATNGTFTVNFNSPTTTSTSFDFAFTGTATFTSDYAITYSTGTTPSTTSTGTLTVPTGVSSVTITATPVDDTDIEPTETIVLTISNPTGGYTIGTPSGSINITSNDVAPTVSVNTGVMAAEPARNGSFIFTLTVPAPLGGVTINYAVGGTAIATVDYNDPANGTINILQGQSSFTLPINVIDDNVDDQGKQLLVYILSVNSPYTIAKAFDSMFFVDNDIIPIPISASYNQDFNTLQTAVYASALMPSGWMIMETGGGARDNGLYTPGDGTSGTGDTYNFGNDLTNTERAIGSLASGSLQSSYGGYFINNSGTTITRLKVSYTGEEWRLGAVASVDRLGFQYSLNATSLNSGTWINYSALDFVTPNKVGTGAKDGNAAANRTSLTYTITGLSIPNGGTFFLRWNDADATGTDDGLAIDDVIIEVNPSDAISPIVNLSSLTPVPSSNTNGVYFQASATFNEDVIKGTGNILVRRLADNSIAQTIAVTDPSVTVVANRITFVIQGLQYNSSYYIEIEAGAFTDAVGNSFSGISGNTTWPFSTRTAPVTGVVGQLYTFATCSTPLQTDFTEVSLSGAQAWTCSNFGYAGTPTGTAAFGLEMNGFANGSNFTNEDWLISPSFDLTGTTFPLLSFYSRTAFSGSGLQLKVSTDYVMGNPASATWSDLNGKFPSLGSNVWVLSNNINLAAFKQANVHFAFVYSSSDQDGARWTLDNLLIENSATPPPPSLTLSTRDIQFGFAPAGGNADKTFTLVGNDITSDMAIDPVGDFRVSLSPAGPFVSSLTLAQATFNNVPTTIYARFAPTLANKNYSSYLTVTTAGVSSGDSIDLKGTSIDPINTLEVVNWNVEWLGSAANGPTNNVLQEANVQSILQNIGADVYGLVEVVDEPMLARIVSNMPGYSYIITNYGSHTNPFDPIVGPLSEAQKEAFVYKTAMFSNITSQPLVTNGVNTQADLSNPAFNYFASGRYPFMMKADVTLNGATKTVRFVLLHAKADTDNGSYGRRKNGSDTLKYTLNNLYPNDNIILLGDINDDLDSTIASQISPRITSYIAFTADTVTTFKSPTLALSLAGKKSTTGYNDMIDHVILSDEMNLFAMGNAATVLNDVSSLVPNYANTTSDHYPIFTRYAFDPVILPVKLISFTAVKQGNNARLNWTTAQEINSSHFVVERSADGRTWLPIANVAAAGSSTINIDYTINDLQPVKGINYYRLLQVDLDGRSEYSAIRVVNFNTMYSLGVYPNPAKDVLYITADAAVVLKSTVQVINMQGQVLINSKLNGNTQPATLNIGALKTGSYFIKFMLPDGTIEMKKFIKE